jgi:triacylglycerol lipase
MGQYTNNTAGKVQVDSSWWPNDGIVSVRSAIAPHEGSTDKIVDYNSNSPQKGVWNYMGKINNVNHLEAVSQQDPIHQKSLQNRFMDLAKMLNELPL